jgi:arsenate-mycothiol transferase
VTDRRPIVLFICVSNAGKSVMAQHLMRHAAGDAIAARSAGTHAKAGVNALSVQALAELGIDLSGHQPTQLTDDMIAAADLVVIVGTQAHIHPPPNSPPVRTWDTDEPSLRGIDGIERMRLIRDDIAQCTRALIAELQAASTPSDP